MRARKRVASQQGPFSIQSDTGLSSARTYDNSHRRRARPCSKGRHSDGTLAALTILSPHETTTSELSLQQHLDIAPDLVAYTTLAAEGDSELLVMAQPVPHQAQDKKRVKVYELRNNDWFDRGTGFCTATFYPVRPFFPISRRAHLSS